MMGGSIYTSSPPSWSSAGAEHNGLPRPMSHVARQHSDTNTLSSTNTQSRPAVTAAQATPPVERRGLSAGTLALAREALHPDRRHHDAPGGDRTCQFFNGLQWLLDSTLEARPPPRPLVPARRRPLTEESVEAFNIMNEAPSVRRIRELNDHEVEEQGRVRAWVANQSNVDVDETSIPT